VLLVAPAAIRTEEARESWEALGGTRARLRVAEDPEALAEASEAVTSADVVVAAIFGTGVRAGPVREPYASAISLVNASRGARVAVDLPSGIDPETGSVNDPAVVADVTLALHRPKTGLRGREEHTGELVVLPIGIREEGTAG
jgi:NAD(P)H-hydrate epimerase